MSPLTKALVLLVTVLSIVLVALVIPFVAQTDNLNAEISALETKVSVSQAAAAKAGREKAELESQLAQAGTDQSQTLTTLRTGNAALQQEKASLEASLKEANAQVAKNITTISLMSATQDQLTQLLEDRNAIVSEAQSSNVQLKTEAAQLIQANNDLDAQVTALSRNNRLLTEKIVDLQEQLAGQTTVATGSGLGGPAFTGQQIRGSVTGIEQVDDIILISLNVGSNDAVNPNTKFVIFRNNDQFVGTATIKSVDETVSVAKIDSAKQAIQVGDNAMTGINY
ncbi:MAG: hypothetical protein AAGH99_00070 [Planctomycetota bacterium]